MADFYPANQIILKKFQKVLIGWKKAGPPKKSLLFWSCKQANNAVSHLGPSRLPVVVAQPGETHANRTTSTLE